MYVAGIAGGQSFCLLDAAFRQVGGPFSPTPDTAGYITQGCACDARYIYFVLYRQNVITVYDWEGRHIRTLPITVSGEPENLSQVGGSLYVASAAGGASEPLTGAGRHRLHCLARIRVPPLPCAARPRRGSPAPFFRGAFYRNCFIFWMFLSSNSAMSFASVTSSPQPGRSRY